MHRITFYLFLLLLINIPSIAQDLTYVKNLTTKLASPEFEGRGYVRKGDTKAALFLAKEAESIGLKAFPQGYLQEFSFPINTYPKTVNLSVDGRELIPGEDYLVRGNSPSLSGKFKIAWINQKVVDHEDALINMINNIDKSYVIAIDTAGIKHELAKELINVILKENPTKASAILWIQHKGLTYKLYKYTEKFPIIEIKPGKLNPEDSSITLKIKHKFIKNHKAQNVIAFIPGQVDTFICFTAHYDHLGAMGNECYFPGGNDNASGSAMLMNLAKDLVKQGGKNHYGYVFMWFAAEEAGLLGSKYFTENPYLPLSSIKSLINFDMIGSGEEGITVVNGEKYPQIYQSLFDLNQKHLLLKEVKKRGVSANSDHHYFSEQGVPAIFIYTMGNYKEYHNIYDQGDKVPFTAYPEFYRLIMLYINSLQMPIHE